MWEHRHGSRRNCRPAVLCWLVTVALLVIIFGVAGGAKAEPAEENDGETYLTENLHLPLRRWNPGAQPRVVILALHGFMLHGGTFDRLARHLTSHGALVIAPDLRGFGRWYHAPETWPGGRRIAYKQSEQDALILLRNLRSTHPKVPVVCLGESMGANLCVRLAASHPALVDGVILSSPCIVKRRVLWRPRIVRDAVIGILCPWWQVDLVPYAHRHISAKGLRDPLVRKRVSVWEVLQTLHGLKTSLGEASAVKSRTKVLLLHGSDDQLCKFDAMNELADRIGSTCKSVRCVPNRGHLLLESGDDLDETAELIDSWLGSELCADVGKTGRSIGVSSRP